MRQGMDIIDLIAYEIDDRIHNIDDSDKAITYYNVCNDEEKQAIDEFLFYVCGSSFKTLINRGEK